MKPEIASLPDRMARGGDWRLFRDEIAALHAEAKTEAEYVTLLEAHQKLVAQGEYTFDAGTYSKILPIAQSEYLLFLSKEATEDGVINPALLDRVMKREITAGRLDPGSHFAKLAAAGGAVLGDSAELTAHRCKRGDFLFYGMAAAGILAFGLARADVSPLWLILVGLLVGWYLNERERKCIKSEITERRG
jgi:hypothetical protein